MDDLPPMRPVSIGPENPRSEPPVWGTAVWLVALAVAAGSAVYLPGGSASAWAAAVACFVVGSGVFFVSLAIELRVSRGRRIPFWKSSPVRSRYGGVTSAAGMCLLCIGASILARDPSFVWWAPLAVVVGSIMFTICASYALHNRRVRATSDA